MKIVIIHGRNQLVGSALYIDGDLLDADVRCGTVRILEKLRLPITEKTLDFSGDWPARLEDLDRIKKLKL